MTTHFDANSFLSELRRVGCGLGEPFTFLLETSSTNDDAKRALAAGATHGATFLADLQRQGRGRRGRHWYGQPAQGLLFSIVLRPRIPAAALSPITLALGLAVREALARHVTVPLLLKWPNDVLAGEQKLAGLLVESDVNTPSPALVAGIGINVLEQQFDAEVQHRATSLARLGAQVTREALLVDVLQRLDHWLSKLEAEPLSAIVDELQRWDALRGKTITVEGEQGVGAGIDPQGRLLLQRPDGRIVAIQSGSVEFGSPLPTAP